MNPQSHDTLNRLRETYSRMSDEELLRLAIQKDTLLDVGKQELESEMQRRGLDTKAVASFESKERKALESEEWETHRRKSEAAEARLRVGQRLITLVVTAVAMNMITARIFSLSGNVIEGLTSASMSMALALSFLGWILPEKWSPWRKTFAMALGLAAAIYLFVLVMWMTASRSHR